MAVGDADRHSVFWLYCGCALRPCRHHYTCRTRGRCTDLSLPGSTGCRARCRSIVSHVAGRKNRPNDASREKQHHTRGRYNLLCGFRAQRRGGRATNPNPRGVGPHADAEVALAAVTLSGDHELDAAKLSNALSCLPLTERPSIVHVVDDIERTAWFRLRKFALRQAGLPSGGVQLHLDHTTGRYSASR